MAVSYLESETVNAPDLNALILLQELISRMLQVNIESRYTAEKVLTHPWVAVSTDIIENCKMY